MNKQAHSLKPFLPAFVFIVAIVSIYVIGQSTLFKDSKGLEDVDQKAEVGFVAPDFAIKDVYGSQAPFSYLYQKKPVLLIFWSTWCPYCAQELPDLITFSNTYQDKIQVVLVISGESEQAVKTYISQKNIIFLASLDSSRAIWQLYDVKGTPHHFLINTSGEIIAAYPGMVSSRIFENMILQIR